MSDPTDSPETSPRTTLVRIDGTEVDLGSVLVVDPAVLHADSDPVSDWVRATAEGIGNMTAEEWVAWIDEYSLLAA